MLPTEVTEDDFIKLDHLYKMDGIYISAISKDDLENLLRKVVKEEINEALPDSNQSEQNHVIITRQEAANLLGVSLNTLNDWTKRGILQSYRIGTRIRYNKADVLNALKKVESPIKNR